jgi:hypothetical protein
VDARCSPKRVFAAHLANQLEGFGRHGGTTATALTGFPPPAEAESPAVPADDRLRFDDNECGPPVSPKWRTAPPTGTGLRRSAWVASPNAAEHPVDGEARGSRVGAPRGSERKREARLKGRTRGARKGIEGKRTTPSLSIRLDFTRTAGTPFWCIMVL